MNPPLVDRRTLLRAAVSLPLAFSSHPAESKDSSLLVCMPVGVGAGHDLRAPRVQGGAATCFKGVNAAGGVYGRDIELITVADDGSPSGLATRLRESVRQRNVLAVMCTLGDRASEAAAEVADDLRLPLVAPLSGKNNLNRAQHRSVFRLRPEHAVEAAALASQLRGMACRHAALIHDPGALDDSSRSIVAALELSGIRVSPMPWNDPVESAGMGPLRAMSQGSFQAAVINLGPMALGQMFEQGIGERPEWPNIIAAISSGDPGSLLGVFPRRDVAFTTVVPHPEVLSQKLVREFNDDIDQHGTGMALSFEGLEAYLGARLVAEALRRLPGSRRPIARDLQSVLEANTEWDIADFRLKFGQGRRTGSDWVNVVMRTRNGKLIAMSPSHVRWRV